MGSEFKSKYTGTEIDNILDNALNGGVLDISEYFESLLDLYETDGNVSGNLENPLLIELFEKIIEIKPTILTATINSVGKFSTSAIKWVEACDNENFIFVVNFKFFHPFGGLMSITLLKLIGEPVYTYFKIFEELRYF